MQSVSGQQVVALDFVPDAPPVPVAKEGEDFVLPTAEPGGLSESSTLTTPQVSQPTPQVSQPTGPARTGMPLQ